MADKYRRLVPFARQGGSLLLAAMLAAPLGWSAAAQTTQSGSSTGAKTAPPSQTAQPAAPAPDAPAAPATASPSTSQNATPPPAAPAPQMQTAPPQGVAIAPYEKDTGVAASRPAGAVIAPGKQRRRRSILIRVGLILGAAAAIGTVVGLSATSSSRP
jgi:hypothetical protein